MIERKFPEPGTERTLQGSSSSASPGKEKQSAGDRRRDRKWREYQESLAAEAAQGANGGTPVGSPKRAKGGHHPGHTTLGNFIQVAKQAKAKPRPLLLRKSGPSSDVESAHRGRMPADQASSSSSVAPHQRDVARACERTCGVPCNLRVARQRATQRNAAVEGTVGIPQEEATGWGRGVAFHASTVAAIPAGLTAAAAHEAATARILGEVAEVKALEEALAQEIAKKEAEERAHVEATAKAQADAARKDAIEAARRKVAEERAKTEAELAALEAEKARLQQTREAEAARAREEAEGRAAAATAAAMAEAEAKLRRETPRGGSRVETLRKLFEGDASSKMALDPEEVDTGSSGSSGPSAYRRRKGKGKTPERSRRPAGGHPRDSDPFFTATDIAEEWLAEEAETSPWSRRVRVRISLLPTGARSLPRAGPRRPGGATWTRMMTWTSTTRRSPHPRTHRGNPTETHLDRADPAEALLEDPLRTPTTHQGKATRIPPGGGLSTSEGGSSPSSAR